MRAHLNVEKSWRMSLTLSPPFFLSISPLWSIFSLSFPPCYFTDVWQWKQRQKMKSRKKSGWGKQMVVSERHLALCLISGERVRLSKWEEGCQNRIQLKASTENENGGGRRRTERGKKKEKGRSDKPVSLWEEVWKLRLGIHSWVVLHVESDLDRSRILLLSLSNEAQRN